MIVLLAFFWDIFLLAFFWDILTLSHISRRYASVLAGSIYVHQLVSLVLRCHVGFYTPLLHFLLFHLPQYLQGAFCCYDRLVPLKLAHLHRCHRLHLRHGKYCAAGHLLALQDAERQKLERLMSATDAAAAGLTPRFLRCIPSFCVPGAFAPPAFPPTTGDRELDPYRFHRWRLQAAELGGCRSASSTTTCHSTAACSISIIRICCSLGCDGEMHVLCKACIQLSLSPLKLLDKPRNWQHSAIVWAARRLPRECCRRVSRSLPLGCTKRIRR